jgi:hypothetical protein
MHNRTLYPHRPRVPLGLLFSVALVALIVIAGLISWFVYQFSLLDPSVAALFRVALFAALYGIPMVSAAVGLIAVYNRFARIETIRADKVIDMQRATVMRFPEALTSLSYHALARRSLPCRPPSPNRCRHTAWPARPGNDGYQTIGKPHPLGR